jgi:hypothetical protein
MIVEKDGTVSYAENEASPKDVEVSFGDFLGRVWENSMTD